MDNDYLTQVRSILGDGTAVDPSQSAGSDVTITSIRTKPDDPFADYDTNGAVTVIDSTSSSYTLASDINQDGSTSKQYTDLTFTKSILSNGAKAMPTMMMASVYSSLSSRVDSMSWTSAAFSSIAVSGGYVSSSYKTRNYLHAPLSAPHFIVIDGVNTLSASNGLSEWTLPTGLSANVPLTATNESCNVSSISSTSTWNDLIGTSLSVPISSMLSYCPTTTITKEFSASYPSGTIVEHNNSVTADFLITIEDKVQQCVVPNDVNYIRMQIWSGYYSQDSCINVLCNGDHSSTVKVHIEYYKSSTIPGEWRSPVKIITKGASYIIDPRTATDHGILIPEFTPMTVEYTLFISDTLIYPIRYNAAKNAVAACNYSNSLGSSCYVNDITGASYEISSYGSYSVYTMKAVGGKAFSASFAYPTSIDGNMVKGLTLEMMSTAQCNICTVASRQHFTLDDSRGGVTLSHAAKKLSIPDHYANISPVSANAFGLVDIPVPSLSYPMYGYINNSVVFYTDTTCNISIKNVFHYSTP